MQQPPSPVRREMPGQHAPPNLAQPFDPSGIFRRNSRLNIAPQSLRQCWTLRPVDCESSAQRWFPRRRPGSLDFLISETLEIGSSLRLLPAGVKPPVSRAPGRMAKAMLYQEPFTKSVATLPTRAVSVPAKGRASPPRPLLPPETRATPHPCAVRKSGADCRPRFFPPRTSATTVKSRSELPSPNNGSPPAAQSIGASPMRHLHKSSKRPASFHRP